MRKYRALICLLVLCLCVGGRIAHDETRLSNEGKSSLLSPITGHNWKYPREQHRLVQHSSSPIRRPFDDEDESENDVRSSSSSSSSSIELGQLNLHEAQLARLHGLGPAEIAALYNWQQRMRLPPIFGRNAEFAVKRSQDAKREPLAVASVAAPEPAAPSPASSSASSSNETHTPAWPKRSSGEQTRKPEKDKSRSSTYNRRDKSESKSAGKGKSSSNQQQQQQRQRQQQESVASHFEPTNKGKEHEHGRPGPPPDVSRINRNLATQFLLRSPRENRQYDVPIIECPPAEDGMERFACPTPDIVGRYRCIDDHVLCDGFIDCPGGEDEDGQACMFYKTMKAHLDLVADALLRWVRGR